MRILTVLAALALLAPAAGAQAEPRRFTVGAHAGTIWFDDASAFENAGFAGIDASYALPAFGMGSRALDLGVGFNVSASLPTTRYDQFPAVLFDFGDTSFIKGVSQRVLVLEYGAQATVGTTLGRFRLYGLGGAGFYTMRMDPRLEREPRSFNEGALRTYTEPAFQLGGGVNWIVSRSIGMRAEVRNVTWTSFDRDRLDATVRYAQDQRLRDVFAAPVEAKSTVNNLRLAIVFSYVPGTETVATTGEGQ